MATYQGRKVKLNKPFRLSASENKRKKFGVYVKNKSSGQKTLSPAYWSIRAWKKNFPL